MTKKRIAIGASILTMIMLVMGAIGVSESTRPLPSPTITASDEATLKYPEPTITADARAKLPPQPKPKVKTTPAPKVDPVPAPIVETRDYHLFPLYPIQEQAPYAIVPEPAPAQRPIYPLLPPVSRITPSPCTPLRPPEIHLPQPLLPPVLPEPESSLLDPVTGILEPITPALPDPLAHIP